MRRMTLAIAWLVALSNSAQLFAQPDKTRTRLLQMPAVSRDHVAFVYAGNLWVCDLDGKNVRRLTSDLGPESNPGPVFSPDGRTLAFSGQYDGNTDVYTIPVSGGPPTRHTWHPSQDLVRGWTPDGGSVLFVSSRECPVRIGFHAFVVPVGGGFPTKLPIPNVSELSYSPDGSHIAYTPQLDTSGVWKHYRGGMASRIWIMRLSNYSIEQVPQPATRCNDTNPCWLGDTIYFRSDRNGEFNLFAFDTRTKTVKQLTHFKDFPVISLNVGGGNLVFEQAGYIHRLDLNTSRSERLEIGVATDLPERRARFITGKGAESVRNGRISPNGARVAIEFHGEIITVPAEKGEPQNLTNTPGVHERSPIWSPDGNLIAYFSDEGGEYSLHVCPADGKGKVTRYELTGAGFYEDPVWSPDSKKIAYLDNAWSLYWLDLTNGSIKKIASEPIGGPARVRSLRPTWSPDSNWIAYALGNRSGCRIIYVHSLGESKSSAITDGMSDATEPAFDASGKYLYFFASTDSGPANQWFNLSSVDRRATRSLYVGLLRRGTPSPLARQSDEERVGDEEDPRVQPDAKDGDRVQIDFEGLDRRLLPVPLPAGDYRQLRAGAAGTVFYLAQPSTQPGQVQSVPATLMRYDLTRRKCEILQQGVTEYDSTRSGKKAFIKTSPNSLSIVRLAPGQDAKLSELNVQAITVRVDPAKEWREIFDESWRINRDYFYAPNMHGSDWRAIKNKYAEFLPDLTSSDDLYRVIRWMLSELTVSHSWASREEKTSEPKRVPGGLLGADYVVANGRYRFKKVYAGATWWPALRAPLAVPGVDVQTGEYLLAVRGVDVKPPTNLYALFENTADKSIEITVGPNPNDTASRTVRVEPLADEYPLRNLNWVEGNLKRVHQATRGRVAYVYLPDTGKTGHAYFDRYFYSQLDKKAIILDERFNSGGSWADYYLDHLRRPFSSYWAMRYGADFRSPSAAIHGPRVMIINEPAGSGGDGLAWMFRQSKLGLLVGKRTWGGEVGTLGFPALLDGGIITAPNFALWSPQSGWVVENEGVPPDIEVEQWPADVLAGHDPQLEKAIEIVTKQLQENPQEKPVRPEYPIRVK